MDQLPKLKHICPICDKSFVKSSNVNSHIRKVHKQQVYHPYTHRVKCSLCDFMCTTVRQLVTHTEKQHEVNICQETFTFNCEEQFIKWKESVEKETSTRFVKKGGSINRSTYFYCFRSGKYTPKGCGKRNLKMNGSNKIGSFCPARIKLTKKSNGSLEVLYVKTHLGHTVDPGRVPLTENEKKIIAEKIAQNSGISTSAILDAVRNSTSCSDLERTHVLTRKDIQNIQQKFHLRSGVQCKNDVESSSKWVKDLKVMSDSPVILFENQNQEGDEVTCWNVQSETNLGEIYTVTKAKECLQECPLRSKDCQACMDNYRCTCIDNVIQQNTCKHIRLVCAVMQNSLASQSPENASVEDGQLIMCEEESLRTLQELQQNINVQELGKGAPPSSALIKKKSEVKCSLQRTLTKFLNCVNDADTSEQVVHLHKLLKFVEAQLGMVKPTSTVSSFKTKQTKLC